jgi:xanthine dehydrogenase accessory factor
MRQVTEALLQVLDGAGRGALATVTRTSGSTPQQPGARLLLRPDGGVVGTVGGGAIEQTVLEALGQCVRDGRPRTLTRDLARELGMCCGGRMEVFVEPIEAAQRLIVFGAGHVAQPTVAMAQMIGFDVTVVDDREELNSEARFPGARRLWSEPADAADELQPSERDWLLVITHDHHLDEQALDTYARLPHRYLGLIGSRRKVFRILQRIQARRGLPSLDRVYAPVGVDLGAVSPQEIAVSITAELVALRHGASAGHLRAVDDRRLQKVLSGSMSVEAAARMAEEQSGTGDAAVE